MKKSAKVLKTQKNWKDIDGLIDIRYVNGLLAKPSILKKSDTREQALSLFKSIIGLTADSSSVFIESPVGKVEFTKDRLFHFVEKIDSSRERFSNYVIETIQNPFEVWLSKYDDDSSRHIFIGLFEGEFDFLVTTWLDVNSGDMFWNAMQVKKGKNYLNNQRIGYLKYQSGQK